MVNATDNTLLEAGQRCLDADGSFLKYMGTVSFVNSHNGTQFKFSNPC